MERVRKGATYWRVGFYPWGIITTDDIDTDDAYDRKFFANGNYFHTEEEAESMAKKLRAVLKGADVIEWPSEEEMEAKIKEVSNKTIRDAATSFLSWINEMSPTFYEWAIKSMINYLKSKIIK